MSNQQVRKRDSEEEITELPNAKKQKTSGCPFHNGFGVVPKHAAFFADKDGKTLSREGMTDAHTKQKITKLVDLKARAIMNIMGGEEPTVDTIVKFENPAATGLWDKNGNFNEERFEQLKKKKIVSDGKEILTRRAFDDLLEDLHGNKNLGIAGWVYYAVPVTWRKVTQGSLDELFEYYADHWYLNKNGKYEKALTVDHVRAFYTNPNAVMERRMKGELPVPCPKK